MSAALANKVPAGWLRQSDTFTYRGRRYMRSAEGRSTFSADGSVAFPVIPLQGNDRTERMLIIRDGLVSDARCGSYRPWAPDGYRYEGERVTEEQ